MNETYQSKLQLEIDDDYLKVMEMGIDPYKLVNSVYDVLAGKKPLYDFNGVNETNESEYYAPFEGISWKITNPRKHHKPDPKVNF